MSDSDMYSWYNAPASDRGANYSVGGSSSSSSSSSSSGGGLSGPASYGGSYTTTTPTVSRPGFGEPTYVGQPVSPTPPVTTPTAAAGGVLAGMDSKSMISIVLFGGIFVLLMGLFKG